MDCYTAAMISCKKFLRAYHEGIVLSRDTGFIRPHRRIPYAGYDDVPLAPNSYLGPETPGKLSALARVLPIEISADAVDCPFETLEKVRLANDRVGEREIVVIWEPGKLVFRQM